MGTEVNTRNENGLIDELTGLWNIQYVEQNMQHFLKDSEGKGQFWVVDVDCFRMIQEEFGFLFADEVICDIAKLLKKMFSKDTIIAKNEEDAFVLVMAGSRSEEEIGVIAKDINDKVRNLYEGDRIFCEVSASVGIVCITQDSANCMELLEMAEKAVTIVKDQGGNDFWIYRGECVERHEPFKVQKKHKHELQKMLPKVHLTDYSLRFLSETKNTEAAINMLLKRCLEFYQVDQCAVFLVQEGQKNLYCKYESCTNPDVSRYNKTIRFSASGWKRRKERLFNREACHLFESQVDKERLQVSFDVMPENAVVMQALLCTDNTYVGDIFLIDYSGQKVWTEEEITNLEGFAKVLGYYLLVHKDDIESIMDRSQEKGIDRLTGLYNVDKFISVAEEYIKASEEEFVLVYMDIGNFKSINLDLGYDMGDRVLKECARILQEEVMDAVLVGRVYGDQFAVLCQKNRPMNKEEILDNAYNINQMIQKQIRKMCMDENILIHAGMYDIPVGGDMETALACAKMAKNVAKQQWSGKMVIYEEQMSISAQKNYELIGNVDTAIANREFQVYLQPKVDSVSMQIIGAEALVRWIKPDGSMVFPDEFIPFFEKNGRIVDVDYYVYEEVFRYIRRRLDEGLPVVPISMNVSRIHLKDDAFMKKLDELLEKYQVPCEYLEFELTENVYVEKLQEALVFIDNIRKKNIKVSIDDFGSGYSSLNVISTIPLDILKLDKAFMKRGGELTKKDRAVIAHLVELAKDIELEVLCEGVETSLQAEFVKNIGCNAWQGYCFAKPMPMSEFDECMNRNPVKVY